MHRPTPTDPAARDAPRLVVVTGARGFVGSHLVADLRDRGWQVRAVSRTPPPSASSDLPAGRMPAGRDATHWVVHPSTDGAAAAAAASDAIRAVRREAGWRAIVAGAHAVVHLAGIAHRPGPAGGRRDAAARELRRVNVVETAALARAAAQAGVRSFVFVSSIKAAGEHGDSPGLGESDPARPQDCYGLAKRAAERQLLRAPDLAAMRLIILRPPIVYGPGVKANFARLVDAVARGLPLPLAGVANRRSLIYVGNLASAIARALDREDVPGGLFHVCDAEAPSTPELIAAIAQTLDRPARLLRCPVGLLRLAGRATGRAGLVARLTESLVVDGRRFRETFDWEPPHPLRDGLARSLGPGRQPADGKP